MIYAFILAHTERPVVRWARFFEVSTSGYYAWLRARDERAARDKAYGDEVETIFRQSRGTYGADQRSA